VSAGGVGVEGEMYILGVSTLQSIDSIYLFVSSADRVSMPGIVNLRSASGDCRGSCLRTSLLFERCTLGLVSCSINVRDMTNHRGMETDRESHGAEIPTVFAGGKLMIGSGIKGLRCKVELAAPSKLELIDVFRSMTVTDLIMTPSVAC
jgi:hypothetical protein